MKTRAFSAAAWALVGVLAGCQSPTGPVGRGADLPSVAASTGDDPELAAAYVPEDPQPDGADWRVVLEVSIDDIEDKGEAFLETGFKLYDTMLASETTPPTPADKTKFEGLYKKAHGEYVLLVKAVQRLATDLDKPEIRLHIPQLKRADRDKFSNVAQLCDWFKAPKASPAYDFTGGQSLTGILFGDDKNPTTQPGDGMTKAQKDALLLLSQLRAITDDLAFLSSAVTDWLEVKGAGPELRRGIRSTERPGL